jgi:hypothetical protein
MRVQEFVMQYPKEEWNYWPSKSIHGLELWCSIPLLSPVKPGTPDCSAMAFAARESSPLLPLTAIKQLLSALSKNNCSVAVLVGSLDASTEGLYRNDGCSKRQQKGYADCWKHKKKKKEKVAQIAG